MISQLPSLSVLRFFPNSGLNNNCFLDGEPLTDVEIYPLEFDDDFYKRFSLFLSLSKFKKLILILTNNTYAYDNYEPEILFSSRVIMS